MKEKFARWLESAPDYWLHCAADHRKAAERAQGKERELLESIAQHYETMAQHAANLLSARFEREMELAKKVSEPSDDQQ